MLFWNQSTDGASEIHDAWCAQGVDMFGQRVGFLKFKADIINEETKAKVITMSQDSISFYW